VIAMTQSPETPPQKPQLSQAEAQGLLQSLRRKEGTWVQWGQACLKLQQAGWRSPDIFEATGITPSDQNQIIVAAQVYGSLIQSDNPADPAVQIHFLSAGSELLYALRVLDQKGRVQAATLALDKQLTLTETQELVTALKNFARRPSPPPGFTREAGDAMAYQCWRRARERGDLQDRSRLIAQGLKFAQSVEARQQLEALLTDFTVVPCSSAPALPVYRPEAEEELPRIVAIAGTLPLDRQVLEAIAQPEPEGPFDSITSSRGGAWVALPGWRTIRNAQKPVAVLCQSDQFPVPLPGAIEPVLVVVETQFEEWQRDRHYLFANPDQLAVGWFEEKPDVPLAGQVLLILRPRKILDENALASDWSVDGFGE